MSTVTLLLDWTALAITTLSALIAARGAFIHLRSGKPRDRFYEDFDGCATPESLASFSNRRSKVCLLVFSALGVAISASGSMISFFNESDYSWIFRDGLNTSAWVRITPPIVT